MRPPRASWQCATSAAVTTGISSFGEDAAGEMYFTDLGGDVSQIVQGN